MGNAIYYEQCRENGMSPEIFEAQMYDKMTETDKANINLLWHVSKKGFTTITAINKDGIVGDNNNIISWRDLGTDLVPNAYICGFHDAVLGRTKQSGWHLLPKTWQRGYNDAKSDEYKHLIHFSKE